MAAGFRLEADVRQVRLDLAHQIRRRLRWQVLQRILEARGDDAPVRGEQHHLECLTLAALGIETRLHFGG